MLSPVEKDFRRKLENRLPSIKNNKIKKADNIVPSTRFAVQELFKLIIKSEVKIESLRQNLNRLTRFSIKHIFEKFDLMDKNFLIESDVIS